MVFELLIDHQNMAVKRKVDLHHHFSVLNKLM